jgi:hypothetical protein
LIELTWSESDSKDVLDRLVEAFVATPHRFFTEHDLHSHLYHLVEEKLAGKGKLYCFTADGKRVSLVHHEYPTPFRCDMSEHRFRIVGESDRKEQSGGLFRRGHYDLVVLNPDFAVHHDLVIVAGKNYRLFKLNENKISETPLLWACEILFGAHTEPDLPENWIDLVTQDSLKILGTIGYQKGRDVRFLAHGDVVVFLGMESSEKTRRLKEKILQFERDNQFKIRFVTA